jgi:predicted SnoaL-like aldol condensation-catalyzing enzyme
MAMSNLEIAKRFFEAIECRDLASVQALLADSFVAKGPTMELTRQQAIAYLQLLFTAFPDHSFGLADCEEEGDLIHCTTHESGTHRGVLDLNAFGLPLSLPPTNKSFRLATGTLTIRVVDDKVTYFGEEAAEGGGLAGILGQLGVKPPGR